MAPEGVALYELAEGAWKLSRDILPVAYVIMLKNLMQICMGIVKCMSPDSILASGDFTKLLQHSHISIKFP